MFSTKSSFKDIPCPESNCKRLHCLFGHNLAVPAQSTSSNTTVPVPTAKTLPKPAVSTKRARPSSPSLASEGAGSSSQPPSKLKKLGTQQKPIAIPSASRTSSGAPVLRVNAAQSKVAIPVRQTMLKNLYDHFVVLYQAISKYDPNLAPEHALRQEAEVYDASTKTSYRNAVINSIGQLKRRTPPTSISHPSVGTEQEIAARAAERERLNKLRITADAVGKHDLLMTMDELEAWKFMTVIPEGPGGDKPSEEGNTMKCERCAQPFMVKRLSEAEECVHHWGRQTRVTQNGEKVTVYTCCSRPAATAEGCARGPHVFYERDLDLLHSRHPFSFCRDPTPMNDTALDVVAMDCEMIYSTAGMRVARVSAVDGAGVEIYDELVKMDEGVEVIDYNTRFSGIQPDEHAKATLTLSAIRESLGALINKDTILIGHALDNDLKTLRIIHHRCVDTAILFEHPRGPPFRRALRDLVREHLGMVIQSGGGSSGHSSVEDSIATLDLVRFFVLNKKRKAKQKPKPTGITDF